MGDGEGGGGGRRRALVLCGLALPLLVGAWAALLWWSAPRTAGDELRVNQFTGLLGQGVIHDATILDADHRIAGRYAYGEYWVAYPADTETVFARLVAAIEQANVPFSTRAQPLKQLVGPVSAVLPALILVDGLLVGFLLLGHQGAGVTAFGRSAIRRAARSEQTITFADVAGLPEAVEELMEVRDHLSRPDRLRTVGATVPRGVLLTGPPGCGKTLLARALAGECNVPFFAASGADFVELFVGVGPARVRDFFREAKAAAPCLVFIDELDALGRSRAMSAGGDERDATLNQLLVALDGFEPGSGVVVVAATNRPDILDRALLRPGRFDRRVAVELPDLAGREAILEVHLRSRPLGVDVDVVAIARRTPGFSGADLATLVNEAALIAARRGGAAVDQATLTAAIERMVAGPERRSRILSAGERQRIAVHEAGHAVVASALPGAVRPAKLSIVGRGHTGGLTWWEPDAGETFVTRSRLMDRITSLYGGLAAEELVLGQGSSGASGDLAAAATLARRMVVELGMGEHPGHLTVAALAAADPDGPGGRYSERVASEVDAEVQEVLRRCHERATAILVAHRGVLNDVTGDLLAAESLEGEALEARLAHVTPARGQVRRVEA